MSYRLYGTPGSLYTAKARSYLLKQGLPFENRPAGEARFREEIVPRLGRWIIPVLETPEGVLVQDSSDIIAYLEAAAPVRFPSLPETPVMRLIAHIFELFGGEGLLRPAMHYRWNFDDANREFLRRDFLAALAPPGTAEAAGASIFDRASARMRKAMTGFGVVAETHETIECSFADFLRRLDAHLAGSPYLLGGRPTLADWGLTGPLCGHLARDPHPSALIKSTAHRVWRWTERMTSPASDEGEYPPRGGSLFSDQEIPDSLRSLLCYIAEDYLPEVEAFLVFTNAWLAERPFLPDGSNGMASPGDRVIGQASFLWRGHSVRVNVLPYRIYLLQRLQDHYDAASRDHRGSMDDLLSATGLTALTRLRPRLRVRRQDFLEVWG